MWGILVDRAEAARWQFQKKSKVGEISKWAVSDSVSYGLFGGLDLGGDL